MNRKTSHLLLLSLMMAATPAVACEPAESLLFSCQTEVGNVRVCQSPKVLALEYGKSRKSTVRKEIPHEDAKWHRDGGVSMQSAIFNFPDGDTTYNILIDHIFGREGLQAETKDAKFFVHTKGKAVAKYTCQAKGLNFDLDKVKIKASPWPETLPY